MVREGRVFDSLNLKPVFGVGYTVVVFTPGAEVASASSGTTIAVQPSGHTFSSGDWLMADLDVTTYRRVVSATSTEIEVNSNLPVAAGQLLVNLGADTGSTAPDYLGSNATIYTDSGYINEAASSHVLAASDGTYRYYHLGIARWELILDESQAPVAVVTDTGDASDADPVSYGVYYPHLFATSGSGTSTEPWLGWEASVVEGREVAFVGGYFATDDLQIPITLSNTPSLTVIRGAGSALTFVNITSATGQFRVYGSGSGTRVLDGARVTGLTIYAGANNISTGIFAFENGDIGCYVDDVRVDPTASYYITTGFYFLNCENMHIGMLAVRGRATTDLAAGNISKGVVFYTDDGAQRGNIDVKQLHITDITTGLKMSTSSGSFNDIRFGTVKVVNGGTVVNGTLGIDLDTNVEQITFDDLHLEVLANGLDASGVENLVVRNGIASQIHNVANNAGAAFTLTDCDSGSVFCRIDTVYNGVVLAGTTTRMLFCKSAAGAITGTYFSDGSSGENAYLNGLTFTTLPGKPITFSTPLSDDTVIKLTTTTAAQKSPRILFSPSQANMNVSLEVSTAGVLNMLNNAGATVHQVSQTGETLLYSYLRRTVSAAVTASTTHTQVGATALTADINNVSVCANADDAVKLPTAADGMTVVIMNNGAQQLKIWPASGDNLGAGADTARVAALAAGSNIRFTAYDATNWEEI